MVVGDLSVGSTSYEVSACTQTTRFLLDTSFLEARGGARRVRITGERRVENGSNRLVFVHPMWWEAREAVQGPGCSSNLSYQYRFFVKVLWTLKSFRRTGPFITPGVSSRRYFFL